MSLARNRKDINLLEVLESKKKLKISLSAIIGLACIPLVAAVAVAVAFFLITTIADLSEQRDRLNNYIESPQTQAAYQEALSAQDEAARLRADADAVMAALRHLSSYPDLYAEDYSRVFEFVGSDLKLSNFTYDRRSGVLRFNVTASDLVGLPRFAAQMRNSGIFAEVNYGGYTQTKTSVPSSNTSSSSATAGTSGASSSAAAAQPTRETVSYYYSLSCLVTSPNATLPALPESDAQAGADTSAQSGGEAGADSSAQSDGEGGADSSAQAGGEGA
jgi:hypothetical protein